MRKVDVAFWTFTSMALLAGATTVMNVSKTYSAPTPNTEIYKQLDLFGDVIERVRKDYVEKPDDRELIESAINGMLSALDPHSAYLSPKSFQDMQVQTRGEFGGLGIEVSLDQATGYVRVVSPIDETPAAKAGLRANDLITHLDNEPIAGLTLNQAVEKMRGPVNKPIKLRIERANSDPLEVTLVRAVIKINPVRARLEGDGEIGYIKISTFNEQTHANLVETVKTLRRDGGDKIKGFIVDLRNNPGGLLDQAVAVSDDFLERGAIVLTKGRDLAETQRSQARPGDITDGKPIIVLINGGSASASEIVAGALQDHDRAQVVGTRSFGKGSVQTIIPLSGNGAIRLTTARYYTPSGRSIQAKGIVPNLIVEQETPEEIAKREALRPRGEAGLRGHLSTEDPSGDEASGSSAYVPENPAEDRQLQFAIAKLRGTPTDIVARTPEEIAKARLEAAKPADGASGGSTTEN
ncbi:MAG: S41 family peptidase [Hyphomicrobiaceae bacterium]